MISSDNSLPYDRPNLSKDFLAGTAPADWMPLRPPSYYADQRINVLLGEQTTGIDATHQVVQLKSGAAMEFSALLLATGADPIHLPIPATGGARIYYLRTYADCVAIVAAAEHAKRVVIEGASFIGLEVAASLRVRGIEVHVVARERMLLERVFGPMIGRFVHDLHKSHGVHFHLGQTVDRVDGGRVTLNSAEVLDADFLVLGVGVRPSTALAEQAGITTDRGILVNRYLETNIPGIFAAGDVARWPNPRTGELVRVEHWVLAQRLGQVAAQNILGRRIPFNVVPFFWTQQYEVTINYVGHAEKWDKTLFEGSLIDHNFSMIYKRKDKVLAVATVSRDRESLEAERDMELDIV